MTNSIHYLEGVRFEEKHTSAKKNSIHFPYNLQVEMEITCVKKKKGQKSGEKIGLCELID